MSEIVEYNTILYNMSMSGSLTLCPYGEIDAKGFPLHAGDFECAQCKYNYMMDYSNKVVFCTHKKKKTTDNIKKKIKEALNYLDATVGITEHDNTNIDMTKDLLYQALKELED